MFCASLSGPNVNVKTVSEAVFNLANVFSLVYGLLGRFVSSPEPKAHG